MIKVLIKDPIDDVLSNPSSYVDASADIALLEVIQPNEKSQMVLIGLDEDKQSYYFVIEDEDVSEDIYCKTEELEFVFGRLLQNIIKR